MAQIPRIQPPITQQVSDLIVFELNRYLRDRKTIVIPLISLVPLIFIAFGPKIEQNEINSTFSAILVTFGLGILIISGLLFANEAIVTESENKTLSLWIIQPIRRETLFLTRGLVLAGVLLLEGMIFSSITWTLIALKAEVLLSPNSGETQLKLLEVLLSAWAWYVLAAIFYSYLFLLLALISPNNFLLIGFLVGFGEVFALNILFPSSAISTTVSPFLHFINIMDLLVNHKNTISSPLELSIGYILVLTAIEIIFLLYYVSQKNFH